MKRYLIAALALGTAGLPAFAPALTAQGSPQLPGAKDPARVTAGTYAADPAHSLIGWEVNHFGFNDYYGIFGDVAGTLVIDPANPDAAQVDVTIPVANVTHDSKQGADRSPAARRKGWRQARFLRPRPGRSPFRFDRSEG